MLQTVARTSVGKSHVSSIFIAPRLVPLTSSLQNLRCMGGGAVALPEGAISAKTGLPVRNSPFPKASSEYTYEDRMDIPIPKVPFIEEPDEKQQKLLALQTKDWKELSHSEKQQIYRLKFQWSLEERYHMNDMNYTNIYAWAAIFIGAMFFLYEITGIYMWDRTPRKRLFIEPRHTPFRARVKKFMNKVTDVVSPDYMYAKLKDLEIEGVDLE